MELQIITIGRRTARKSAPLDEAFTGYCERIRRYCAFSVESCLTEDKLFALLERTQSRTRPVLVMLDSRGRGLSTEEFAAWIRTRRDEGKQRLILAVGPADGWSAEVRRRADLLLSLGAMTLPHELAAVVMAEQIYRAFTIIEGHPYHIGHAAER